MSDLIPTGQIPDSNCPRCSAPLMVITKRNHFGALHPQFVGCTQYPMCGHTSVVTDAVREKMHAVQAQREAMPVEF